MNLSSATEDFRRGRFRAKLEQVLAWLSGQSTQLLECEEVRKTLSQLDEEGRGLVKAAMQQLGMSARAFHRILKLARTIADLAGSERIETTCLAEAIQYRPRRSA